MKRRWLLWVFIAVGLAGCRQHSAIESKSHAATPGEVGSQLPEFTARDLQGREISSADLKGKIVIIDFWATWCAPCEKEMPGYQQLADRYGSRGLAVVGLKASMMRDTEDPLKFATRIGIHYPLVTATGELTQSFGGIEGLPTTLIYDRNGMLRKKIIGFEYTKTIEAELKQLL